VASSFVSARVAARLVACVILIRSMVLGDVDAIEWNMRESCAIAVAQSARAVGVSFFESRRGRCLRIEVGVQE